MTAINASFNLEDVTQLIADRVRFRQTPSDPHVSLKVVSYGGGLFKTVVSVLPSAPPRTVSRSAAVGVKRTELDQECMRRAERRACYSLRDLVLATRCNRMLTGTARGGLTRDETISCCGSFFANLRDRGFELAGAMVPEQHHGGGVNHGTYHAHIAVRWPAFIAFEITRAAWLKALRTHVPRFQDASSEDAIGSLNVGRTGSAPFSLGRYLSKYLSKDFSMGIAHKKRYICYGPVKRPSYSVSCAPSESMPPLQAICLAIKEATSQGSGYALDTPYNLVLLADNVPRYLTGPSMLSGSESLISEVEAPTAADLLTRAWEIARGSGQPLTAFDEDIPFGPLLDSLARTFVPEKTIGDVELQDGVLVEALSAEHFLEGLTNSLH